MVIITADGVLDGFLMFLPRLSLTFSSNSIVFSYFHFLELKWRSEKKKHKERLKKKGERGTQYIQFHDESVSNLLEEDTGGH